MQLAAYPTLDSILALSPGSHIPSARIDSFKARTIYASSLLSLAPGCAFDCDPDTGQVSGSVPSLTVGRSNAAALNAVLTPGTHLIFDTMVPMGSPLLIPPAGQVRVDDGGSGLWNRGMFMLPGANSTCIQNYDHTNLAEFNVWNSGPSQAFTGKNVTIDPREMSIEGRMGETLVNRGKAAGVNIPRGPLMGYHSVEGMNENFNQAMDKIASAKGDPLKDALQANTVAVLENNRLMAQQKQGKPDPNPQPVRQPGLPARPIR